MIKKENKWSIRAVILVALIGVVMGAIYQYAFNPLYNVIKIIATPTGLAPVADQLTQGIWYMAAPLAIYFVPTMGSGVVGETLAGFIEMALGSQWGWSNLLAGVVQGIGNEIGFFPSKKNYDRFSWVSVLTGAFFANVAGFFSTYFLYGYSKYPFGLLIEMFVVSTLSALFFDGVLVKLITKMFDRIMKAE